MKKIILMMLLAVVSNVVNAEDIPVFQEVGGLTWAIKQTNIEDRLLFRDAESHCSTALGGESGWRLPTISELITLQNSGNGIHMPINGRIISSTVSGAMHPPGHFSCGRHGCDRYTESNEGVSDDGYGIMGLSSLVCVHTSLAANKKFATANKICLLAKCDAETTPVKSGNATIGLRVDNSEAEKAAQDKADAVATRKAEAQQERIYQAEKKAEAAREKANKAAQTEKMRQWCGTVQGRLSLCECAQFNSVKSKGNACQK